MRKKGINLFILMLFATACSHEKAAPVADNTPLNRYCSGCHGAPSATAHTASEWPSVIERMQQHRAQQGKPRLTAAEKKSVLAVLLEH